MEVTSLPRAAGTVRLPPRLLAPLPDDRLVAQIRRGQDAAFEVVYDRHHRGLLSFCRHMLGSPEEAEDAVQQTFVSAYGDITGSDKPIRLKPWLYTIARNRCLSILRSRREEAAELADIPTTGLSDAVLEREEVRRLLEDLRQLPHDQRAALVLSELGDLSHAEIAEIVGCKAVQVKSLVFQARSSLLASKEAAEIPCHEIREQIASARGAALRRGPLRRHIRACPACASFRDEVRRQRQLLAVALPVIPSAALKSSVLGAVGIGPAAAGGLAAGGAVAGGTTGGGFAAGGAATGGGLAVGGASGGGVLASLGALGGAKLAIVAAVAAGVAGGSIVVHDVTSSDNQAATSSAQTGFGAATGGSAGGGARGWFGGVGRVFGATVSNWAVSGAHGGRSGSGVPWAASQGSGSGGHGKDKGKGNGGGNGHGNGSAPQSYQLQNGNGGGNGHGNAYGGGGGNGNAYGNGRGASNGNAYGGGGSNGNAYGNGGGNGNAYGNGGSPSYTTHGPPPQAHGHAHGTNDPGAAVPNDSPPPNPGNHLGSGG